MKGRERQGRKKGEREAEKKAWNAKKYKVGKSIP